MSVCERSGPDSAHLPQLAEDVGRLAARLETAVVLVCGDDRVRFRGEEEPAGAEHNDCLANESGIGGWIKRLFANQLEANSVPFEDCMRAATDAAYLRQVCGVAIGPHRTVVIGPLRTELYSEVVAAIIETSLRPALRLMTAACESTQLTRQADLMQVRLDASALQIAQSFEEQCWLRDLARNLSLTQNTANANTLARGILGPLLDLLRAEDLLVLTAEDEIARSGLTSCSFGSGRVTIAAMTQLLNSLRVKKPFGPIVINNARLLDGQIHNLIAVPIHSCEQTFGHIVAVNRLVERFGLKTAMSAGMPLIDPEFGSVEVGLLEEASVLLSTQSHNIRLVLESQHLAVGTLQAMSRAIDARDPYTRGHSERVARLAFEVAQVLGLEETACQEIYVAGILHDVGKIGIPDRVLLKPSALSEDEYSIIRQHPEIGYRIVEQLGKLHFTLPGVLYHHEHWDGGGYPHQLSGETIPLMARIIAVADSFDSMTSSRPYRHAMPTLQASDIIRAGAGTQWDPMLVRCFHQWKESRVRDLPDEHHDGRSLIPQEPPYADITRSIMALQM